MPEPVASPPLPSGPSLPSSMLAIGGIVLAIAGLYFGREIFIPFALAILLAFALAPIVTWLRRLRLPKVAAVIVAVGFALIIAAGVSVIVGAQLVELAENLPRYQLTIREKIRGLQSAAPGGGLVDRVTSTIKDISKELEEPEKPAESTEPLEQESERKPVPVTIEQPPPRPLEVIRTIAGPLLAPLATAGIVVVFVIFVLLEREDIRDRFIKLVGAGDLQRSTEALTEAASRVSRYLLMQLVVNVTYGVPIGIGLWFIGVPNAVLWGLLATVLRFIPYLGPFLAALFPLAVAFAVDPGWSMLLWVIGLFLVAELISNNFVEPWLYGSSTGLSSLAIIMAAIFWTSLWGPAGLFLSTPLTVCLVVIGRYVPQLEFLGTLLGNEPVLEPEERFYQRLLAGNTEEAVEIGEDYVDETSTIAFFDSVAIPALRLAENDRQRGNDVGYRRLVADTMAAVVREVADHVDAPMPPGDEDEDEADKALPVSVLCIGGRSELDRAGAQMAAQVLAERGIRARVLAPVAVRQHAIGQIDLAGVEVVCLVYLSRQPQVFARYVCRRLKRRAPDLKTVVCYWNPPPNAGDAEALAQEMSADDVALSLEAATGAIEAALKRDTDTAVPPPEPPPDELERREALRALGLASARGGDFDVVASKVAKAFGTPIALVSVIDAEHQIWPGAFGLPDTLDECRQASRDQSICTHVVSGGEMLVVEDVARDPRFASNPFLLENGIRFYAGAPLRAASGHVLGSLCIIDTHPRAFTAKDGRLLQTIADELIAKVEAQCAAAAAPATAQQPAALG